MARVTVEDCEEVVKNRFDLVVLASQRTRQIISGNPPTVEVNDEKKPVIALREIAAQTVSVSALRDAVVDSFRTFIPSDMEDADIDNLEDDTYDPYLGLEMASDNVQVVATPSSENGDEVAISGPELDIGIENSDGGEDIGATSEDEVSNVVVLDSEE